jgi:hypothetical protein
MALLGTHAAKALMVGDCRNSCTRAWGGQARRPGVSKRRLCAEEPRTGRRRARPPAHAASRDCLCLLGRCYCRAAVLQRHVRACLQHISEYQQEACVCRLAQPAPRRRHCSGVCTYDRCCLCLPVRAVSGLSALNRESVPWGALEHSA